MNETNTSIGELIAEILAAKQGNQDFLLSNGFGDLYGDGGSKWGAVIGNPRRHSFIGEHITYGDADFSGRGDTPEAALRNLLRNMKK